MMKISQVLARAAKLVERDGWCRGMREGKARCALIAIADACHLASGYSVVDTPPYNFFTVFYPGHLRNIGGWNTMYGRTGAEVACWLASASEWAKVQGR